MDNIEINKILEEFECNTKLKNTHKATAMLRNKREDRLLLRELNESLGIISDEDFEISVHLVDSVGCS